MSDTSSLHTAILPNATILNSPPPYTLTWQSNSTQGPTKRCSQQHKFIIYIRLYPPTRNDPQEEAHSPLPPSQPHVVAVDEEQMNHSYYYSYGGIDR